MIRRYRTEVRNDLRTEERDEPDVDALTSIGDYDENPDDPVISERRQQNKAAPRPH